MSVFRQLMMRKKIIDIGTKVIDVRQTGTLTQTDGIFTGFSNSNYLSLGGLIFDNGIWYKKATPLSFSNFFSSANSWEFNGSFKLGTLTANQMIIQADTASAGLDVFYSYNAGNRNSYGVVCDIYTTNGRIDIMSPNNSISVNTKYYFRIQFTGTEYKFYLNTDGQTYDNTTLLGSVSSVYKATNKTPNYFNIGHTLWGGVGALQSNTQIDISDWNIKKDNQIYWSGVRYVSNIINATIYGSTIYNGYELSNFSLSNYASAETTKTFTLSSVTSFDIGIKVKTPSSWNSSGRIFNWRSTSGDTANGPYMYSGNTKALRLTFYNGSNYFGCNAVTTSTNNKYYWLRWVYDGTNVYGYYKENENDNWILNDTVQFSANNIRFLTNLFDIGCRRDNNSVTVWNGSVDMSEFYMIVNNINIYKGVL